MPLQKTVNVQQAFGVPGDFYDDTPRRVHAYELVNNSSTAPAVGLAYTATSTAGQAQPGGSGTFLGICVNPKEQALLGGLTPSLTLPSGAIGSLCSFGHVIVQVAAQVDTSYLPIYNTTTGVISGVTSGSSSAGSGNAFIPNAKFVYVSADANGLAVLELNGFANAPAAAGA